MTDSSNNSMAAFSTTLKKLLVMTAFTAANHGLEEQYDALVQVFPLCIEDDKTQELSLRLARTILDNSNLTTANYESFIATISELSAGN